MQKVILSVALIVSLLVLACSTSQSLSARPTADARDTLIVLSYNIENFFHPDNDSLKNDDAFTPDGGYLWTNSRMQDKAHKIARVITSCNGWTMPDIVGIAEIEGPKATESLLNYGNLNNQNLNYNAVCYDTPDKRGVATAMLYNANRLRLMESKAIYTSVADSNFFTRDVLYAKLELLSTSSVVHVMVNHWPSKYGGEEQTIWMREFVARRVRSTCDSILALEPEAKIVLLGDFNDVASAPSIANVLGAKTLTDSCSLRNLSADTDEFSYKYRGVWSTIDHIIVSSGCCTIARPSFSVVRLPFLLEEDSRYGGEKPKRAYIGMKYNYSSDGLGGYSDHLPVMVKILL